ncbi:MAG TPA: nucleotidyltransferase [Polyangiales bacterium]|nr:nucleotidyltransferase [Polyangiales bacterium]
MSNETDTPQASSAAAFYARALRSLAEANVPHLVGGGYAFSHYTGVQRQAKDLDIFVHPHEVERALRVLADLGCHTEMTFPHWLSKALYDGHLIDLIYSSGNGLAVVDEAWFTHATQVSVLGLPVQLIPVEEMIWSKAFILERERCDAADVLHLLRAAPQLDWDRLVRRFAGHYRVLYCYLILFGYTYPSERTLIPERVLEDFARRFAEEQRRPDPSDSCQGTLLSRSQFLVDIIHWGYADRRLDPDVHMTREHIAQWTAAIPEGAGNHEGHNPHRSDV